MWTFSEDASTSASSSPTSSGITINGNGRHHGWQWYRGALIGVSDAPDIGAYIDGGGTADLELAGSYSGSNQYSLKMGGMGQDLTNFSDAAIGVEGDYDNGILVSGTYSGIYGLATNSAPVTITPPAGGVFSNFVGDFGVRGEANGEPTTACRLIGVWGLASGNSGTNTKSIGVLAQGGNGEIVAGNTNVALDVELGDLTIGMTSDPHGKDGTGVSKINNAVSEGPSGAVNLTTSFSSGFGPGLRESSSFQVGNEYASSTSIILATVQNDPDAGNSTFTVEAIPSATAGQFTSDYHSTTFGAAQHRLLNPVVNVRLYHC